MTKKVNNILTKEEKAQLPKTAGEILFVPTNNQLKTKAKFWSRFQPGPNFNISSLTAEKVYHITDVRGVLKWWRDPAFVKWLLNREEEREKINYLFNKSLDTLEQILDDPEANVNAKSNLIKLLAEMTGYLSRKGNHEKFADEEINKMSERELVEFLARRGVRVTKEIIIEQDKDGSGEKSKFRGDSSS